MLNIFEYNIQHSFNCFELHATRGASERLKKYNAKVVFLLGQGEEGQAAVMEESRLHSDIVQEDFKVGETGFEASRQEESVIPPRQLLPSGQS